MKARYGGLNLKSESEIFNSSEESMSADRAATILARFQTPITRSSASCASCRRSRPNTARRRGVERGADRVSRRDDERVDCRRAGRLDADGPAGAGRLRGDVQPRSRCPRSSRPSRRSSRRPSSAPKWRSSGCAPAATTSSKAIASLSAGARRRPLRHAALRHALAVRARRLHDRARPPAHQSDRANTPTGALGAQGALGARGARGARVH